MSANNFRRAVYFEDDEACLENHFKVLETFQPHDPFFS
jgi:hypothetical protein